MKMRYLVFTEYGPEEMDVAGKLDATYQAERGANPEKYMRYGISTSFFMGDLPKLTERFRFVDIFEADSPEQMMNNMAEWCAMMDEVKTWKKWIVPLQELTDDFMAEHLRQYKFFEETREQSKTFVTEYVRQAKQLKEMKKQVKTTQ